MRTLSDAAVYKLPVAPIQSAVIGLSPGCVIPKLAEPANEFPDEVSVLIALTLLERVSHTLMYGPQAENSKFDFESVSTATTGPGCDKRQIGPVVFSKSHILTVLSAAAVYR